MARPRKPPSPFRYFNSSPEVIRLPDLQQTASSDAAAKTRLNTLERVITREAVAGSAFRAILNEKDPPPGDADLAIPPPTETGSSPSASSNCAPTPISG